MFGLAEESADSSQQAGSRAALSLQPVAGMGPAPSRDVPGAGELDADAEDIEDHDDVIRPRPLPDYLVRAHPYSCFSLTTTFSSVKCYTTNIATKV